MDPTIEALAHGTALRIMEQVDYRGPGTPPTHAQNAAFAETLIAAVIRTALEAQVADALAKTHVPTLPQPVLDAMAKARAAGPLSVTEAEAIHPERIA